MTKNKTVSANAFRFFTGTLLSRASGLLRDIAMAYSFGTSLSTSAFFAAFRLSQAPRRLLGEGGMQTAFIPHYESLKRESPEKARQFFIDLTATVCLIVFVLIGLSALLFWGISPYLSEGGQEVGFFALWMMPGLLFICLFGLSSALVECHGSFFRPGIAPIAFNGVWIMCALFLGFFEIREALTWLSCAISIACLAQWLVLLPRTREILSPKRLFFDAKFPSPYLRRWLGPLFLANLGIISQQINSAFDPLFALYASDSGPAMLWYALRVEQAPLALFGIAVSAALLPALSQAKEEGDKSAFFEALRTSLQKCLLLMSGATLFLIVFAEPIIAILFERGDFTRVSTNEVSLALRGYALGLIPQTLVLIFAPAFFAVKEYTIPAIGSIIAVIANLLLNSLFVFGWGMGAVSVAIATSLASVVNALFLGVILYKRKGIFN